jgi:hypothetical protein
MSLDTQAKLAIYRHFAETGQRPSLQVVAERVGADVSSVRDAYLRLRAQRVFPPPGGGTTLFSPETTWFLALTSVSPLSAINYQHPACGVRSPMRCVPFSPASAWEAIFGIRSRIVSVNGFALCR